MGAKKRKAMPPTPPAAASSSTAVISSVLGDDDLLREILVRLDFPTSLVRAAAVSRRWLRHASDPAFLLRFRGLHPPRLLGFYVHTGGFFDERLRFVPMPQLPPELAAVIRRGRFDLGKGAVAVPNCRNGRLVFVTRKRFFVSSPLNPAGRAAAVPRLYELGSGAYYLPLLPESAGDRTVVALVQDEQKGWIHLSDARPGSWGKRRASQLIDLPKDWRMCLFGLLAYGKLYLLRGVGYILGFDLSSRSFFQIQLPQGVEYESAAHTDVNFELSRAEGSGFYLIHVKGFQVIVWRHSTGVSAGDWELVDSVCLNQVFGGIADPTSVPSHGDAVQVYAVGDNADFAFLKIGLKIFYFQIKSRAVEKVYELQESDTNLVIQPFMMVWPPTFPTLDDGRDPVD
ncbi:hypothetical protein ACP4OV_012739 [Aristida adscensionis]